MKTLLLLSLFVLGSFSYADASMITATGSIYESEDECLCGQDTDGECLPCDVDEL